MDNAFKTQLIFTHNTFRDATSPRWMNVRNVVDAYDLWGKKIYQEHAARLFSRFKATSNSTCWNVIHDEHVGNRHPGVLRRTLEELGMEPDPTLGVICIAGAPRTVDSKTLVLELDLGLGAHGGIKHSYPLPNFPHTWALVRVTDANALRQFAQISRKGVTRGGEEYHYWAELHVDPTVGKNEISTAVAEQYIRTPKRTVKTDPKSNFKDPAQVAREEEWFSTLADLREKLGQ